MLHETLQYLYNLERFGMKLGLDVMNQLMEILKNPQTKFKTIHVAGTNGKGSTAAFIASILKHAGFKVGLYTSPHLVTFNERIQINNEKITDRELIYYTEKIKQQTEKHSLHPTFFEFTTAIAFAHFAHKNVDIAVIEVGLGGRLDATNILNPEIAVITNIGLEHTRHLGSTLEQIAKEKAGIIKPNCITITAETDKKILKYLQKVCEERNSKLIIMQDHLNLIKSTNQEFTVTGLVNGTFAIPLPGKHQITNACLALIATQALAQNNITIPKQALQDGLKTLNWQARLQRIDNILIDSAHNPAAITSLTNYIKELPNKKVLILGIAEDKNIKEMMKLIAPLFEHIILTQGNYKPAKLETLEKEAKKYTKNTHQIPNVKEAINKAKELAEDNLILITGSIYMVGDALGTLQSKTTF
jgi:dihydrofolate synthase / folylpolyglutamate synthase